VFKLCITSRQFLCSNRKMATRARLIFRGVAHLVRQYPGNVRDGVTWVLERVFGGRAPAPPGPANPAGQIIQANPAEAAGNELVAANMSFLRRLMWWLGGGAVGVGIIWLLRRIEADEPDINDGADGNAGRGNGGGGGGGLDPGFLFFQMVNLIGWRGGDSSSNAGGDTAEPTAADGGEIGVGDAAATTATAALAT
jgi:hypothetical protein